jgi:hypothetical protein
MPVCCFLDDLFRVTHVLLKSLCPCGIAVAREKCMEVLWDAHHPSGTVVLTQSEVTPRVTNCFWSQPAVSCFALALTCTCWLACTAAAVEGWMDGSQKATQAGSQAGSSPSPILSVQVNHQAYDSQSIRMP